jgi:orotate phosphoribosyltransferase
VSTRNRKETLEKLSEALLKIGAFKIGSFQTSGGGFTPYFIDLKVIVSFPEVLDLVIQCLHYSLEENLDQEKFEYLCGVPTSGLLIASILAHDLKKPLIYPASTSRESSTRGIRGILRPGSRVLLLDDVSETGYSIRTASQSVQASGGVVEFALTLIDRKEGAEKLLGDLDISLVSFTSIDEIVETLRDKMALSDEQEQAIRTALQ